MNAGWGHQRASIRTQALGLSPRLSLRLMLGACLCLLAALWPHGAAAQAAADLGAQSRLLQRAATAVVGVRVRAVDEARSSSMLGNQREGSGVVISPDGLVLTIGYLIVEAETVQVIVGDDRVIPARVVGHDADSGLALLQALAPLAIEAAPLGVSARIAERELLTMVSGGATGAVGPAHLVSRRPFTGYWEYLIDGALFTAPQRDDQSGAGLFNARGELVGIGSLKVAHAAGDAQPRLPGNMFVPIDLLPPVLDELLTSGTTTASRRAWMGVICAAREGHVTVMRVTDDSPADVAGLQTGDHIVGIDGVAVSTLDQLWTALWRNGPAEREVKLEIEREGSSQTVRVFTVERTKTFKRPRGV